MKPHYLRPLDTNFPKAVQRRFTLHDLHRVLIHASTGGRSACERLATALRRCRDTRKVYNLAQHPEHDGPEGVYARASEELSARLKCVEVRLSKLRAEMTRVYQDQRRQNPPKA